MNIYDLLNNVIDYFESNLKNEIDYIKVTKILGTNLYTAEQLFKLLTGITMKEYVRYRRLTLAAKDLRENKKVIDIAMTYGYTNPSSFSRSFSAFHHITPQLVKKGHSSKAFPIIHFNIQNQNIKNIDYKIIPKKKFTIYTRKKIIPMKKNSLFIENFWKETKNKTEEMSKAETRYGVSETIINNENEFYYHIGLDYAWPNSNKKTFSATSWFVITCPSNKSSDIHQAIKQTNHTYLPSLNYKLKDHNYLEVYHNHIVEIWFPLT